MTEPTPSHDHVHADDLTRAAAANPIEGGGDYVEVVYDPLDGQRAVDLVTHASAGAISTFIGTTRDNFQGKKVVRLEYEGYIPMAKSELLKICAQIRGQWPSVVGIAMFHRLGVVEVREASVVIAISSPHRAEALEACAFAIDTLKATVPIWKSEQYEGDSRMWKENAEWGSGSETRRVGGCCGPKRVMVPSASEQQTRAAFLMTSAIEPRRLALRYTPPGIIVEYAHSISRFPRQLYHHEIDLQGVVQSSRQRDARERPSSVDEIVKTLIEQHGQVLGDRKVSSRQLARLVQKLIDHAGGASPSPPTETHEPERAAAASAAAAAMLPQADYNRVSETQLKQVKMKMDLVFQQNFVRPGEDGYQYDKQITFQTTQEASDWDDDD